MRTCYHSFLTHQLFEGLRFTIRVKRLARFAVKLHLFCSCGFHWDSIQFKTKDVLDNTIEKYFIHRENPSVAF